MDLKVDLIWDTTLGGLKPVRILLRKALEEAGCPPYWQEWRAGAANLPRHLKKQDRPVVLVNGYAALEDFGNPAAAALLRRNIEKYRNRKKKSSAAARLLNAFHVALPVFILFFPKCPVCWAAYFNVFVNLGIHIPYIPEIQTGLVALSFIFCAFLFSRAPRMSGYLPPSLIAAAPILLLLNKNLLDNTAWINYLSIVLSFAGTTILVLGNEQMAKLGMWGGAGRESSIVNRQSSIVNRES
jgi:hypothetical protein